MKKNKDLIRFNDKTNDKKQYRKQQQHCSEHILRTLKAANHALYYADFGKHYRYGTLRNEMSKLTKSGKVLVLPKECPERFILPEWVPRPEYACVQRNDKRGTAAKFDFLSFLESLPWSSNLGVHNLKLTFAVYNFRWIDDKDWRYRKSNQSFERHLSLSLPVHVQCFDTGTVLVSIKCSSTPFALNVDGLLALSNLLGEVRNMLHAPCIPEPLNWAIVQWHLNRDSEPIEISGLDFHITFKDFFNDAARIYYKHVLNKVRVEVNQSPKRTIKEVSEEILNRGNNPKEANCLG
jgi:hypothetical protein